MIQPKHTEQQNGLKQANEMPGLQETLFKSKDTHKLQGKEWKKVFHENTHKRKDGMSYLKKTIRL